MRSRILAMVACLVALVSVFGPPVASAGIRTAWLDLSSDPAPLARSASGMAYDAGRGEIVLFSGTDTNWNLLSPVQSPPSRSHHVMVSAAGRPLPFGGVRNLFEYLDDTWAFAG